MRNRTFLRNAAICLAVPACALFAAGPALAASDVVVTNTETIQAHLDATGKVEDARVYDQLAFTGKGTVDVANPVSSKGLRNLDGFGGYDVKDGKLVTHVTVDGDKRLRTVSDFDKKIPLTIAVTYLLNGKEVAPGKVVGASGDLEVRYRVENVTATSQQISFDDGTGQQVTKDAQVVIPMVGSLTTVLPSTFTDVSSAQANMAGDGRGGTKLSFTMTLFGPIGSATAEFGYTARIKDGQVPAASISALPVSPLDSPSFKGGAESYKGGADTGVQLTAGATEIDANLLKLRDGASQLLAGLIQLRDGADQLNAGLAGSAAPGAAKLSAGASAAAAGANQLKDGLYKINAGATKLAAGASDAKDGAKKLAAGSKQVAGGLHEAGAKAPELIGGLNQVRDGLTSLDAGLAKLSAGVSSAGSDPKVAQLFAGISAAQAAVSPGGKLYNGTLLLTCGLDNSQTGCPAGPAVKQGLQQLQTDLGGSLTALETVLGCDGTTCTQVSADTLPAAVGPVPSGTPASTAAALIINGVKGKMSAPLGSGGLADLYKGVDDLVAGTHEMRCGMSAATAGCPAVDPTAPPMATGLSLISDGVSTLLGTIASSVSVGVGTPASGPATLRGGVAALQGGVDQISAGGTALIEGLSQLGAGADQVAAGNGDLYTGLQQLSAGAGQLAAGAGDAKTGAGQLADGNRQIAKGASDLASGLNDAAVGSGKLADGLATAADSAPQLKDGAQRLSDEGTKKLVEAGKGTAADYGEKYALIVAGAERAKSEGMAYGAPEGATGVTAYSLELAGMNGESGRNVGRGLGALVVLGFGTGAAALVRRRLV
jgi:putative membrane protein